jgi:excisionase family DNA binding protein
MDSFLSPTFCHNNRVTQIQTGKESPEARWYSVNEVANHLGVAIDTIYRWIERKKMPAHRVGRLWKFKLSEVDAWVRSDGADETRGTKKS